MFDENSVDPLQKVEFLRSYRPWPIIKAAARNPEHRALPAYGQPASGAIIARGKHQPEGIAEGFAERVVDELLRGLNKG